MSIALSQYKNKDRVLLIESGRLHPAFSFTRSTIGTMLGSAGLIVTAAINVPRYEYDSSGNFLGLLIEEAKTNLVTYSDGDVTTYPTRGGVTNATTALAPYFTNSIQFPTSGGANYAYKSITYSVANYVVSCFIKMDDGSFPVVSSNNSTGDLSLVVNGNIAPSIPTPTYVGGGVYRISAYASVSTARISTSGVAQYSTQSRKGFRVTGLQVQLGTVPSSYIPTTSSAVTRSADVLSATLASLGISATAGTFVIEHDVASGNPLVYSGSNAILNSSGGTKVAIAYDAAGWSKSINGGAVTTSGTPLTFGSTLDIGKSPTGGANGHIKRVYWYRTRRPNVELTRLST